MSKTIKRIAILLLAAAVLCLSGCNPINKVKQIKVTSVEMEGISPVSLRSIDVMLAVGIENPCIFVSLSDISGVLKLSGKVIGNVAMDPFEVLARSNETYHLKANISIDKSVSFTEILALLDKETLNKCTLDASVKLTVKGGVSKVFSINDVPVKKLLEEVTNEFNL